MTSGIRIHTKEVDISQKGSLNYFYLVSFSSFIKTNNLFYGIICLDWIDYVLLIIVQLIKKE